VSEWVSCRLVDKGNLGFCSFSFFCDHLECEFKKICFCENGSDVDAASPVLFLYCYSWNCAFHKCSSFVCN